MTLLATSQSFFGSMGPEFLLIIIIGIATFIVQTRLKSVFNQYAEVPFARVRKGKTVD